MLIIANCIPPYHASPPFQWETPPQPLSKQCESYAAMATSLLPLVSRKGHDGMCHSLSPTPRYAHQ